MSYQDTYLWKRTLGKDKKNVKPLRESFLSARENAEYLLGKIRQDFPNLTVHDITHVDSLWNVSDVIIGPKYPINPLEGYILGIAFLIHDAALSYDAVGGITELRKRIEWKDAFADGPGDKDEEEFKKECDFAAIRTIHAKEAEDILSKQFIKNDGTPFYIIENRNYRDHFCKLIGKIAASHHWDIDKVASELKNQINPRHGVPNEWTINSRKLACILRCADAGHIDDGRAPDSIYYSLHVNGVSRSHWESQNHLCQVCEDEDNPKLLRITSINPFEKKDFDAWNVAYDAVRLFDEELKKSNILLNKNKLEEFPHYGVSGASSKEDLYKYIETDGWRPCDFGVHTSNIKLLIENLGGSKLYGEQNRLLVVLRELIQNARDAIRAKQNLEESFDNGKITLRFIEEDTDCYLEVEDNGIGMSMDCIKYFLLDFGSSYWKSSLSKNENPGLMSKKFTSIGRFGIGFYSAFMVAKSVDVYTKRFDKGATEANRVEFPDGLTLSPIISSCRLDSGISTIVRIKLKNDTPTYTVFDKKDNKEGGVNTIIKRPFRFLVAGLDADVYWNDKLIHKSITSPSFDKKEWLKELYYPDHCTANIAEIADDLESIYDEEGNLRGMICFADSSLILGPFSEYNPFLFTNDGLWSFSPKPSSNTGLIGYLDCRHYNISRDSLYLDEPIISTLSSWFTEKYSEIRDRIYPMKASNNALLAFVSYFGYSYWHYIMEQNAKEIFSNPSFFNIDFFDSIVSIHQYLLFGLYDSAGTYANGFLHSSDYILLEEKVKSRMKYPRNDYDYYFVVFLYYILAQPFIRWNEWVGSIWINYQLNTVFGKVIDWHRVEWSRFYIMFKSFKKNYKANPLCDYLKRALVPTRPEAMYSYLGCDSYIPQKLRMSD